MNKTQTLGTEGEWPVHDVRVAGEPWSRRWRSRPEWLGPPQSPRRRAVLASASTAVPFGVAAALAPARTSLPVASVALLMALLVVLLASVGTRTTAVLAALSAGVGFDVFHTRPYGSLAIRSAADVQTTLLLLGVGVVVGQLAVRGRGHRAVADEASADLARIHGVAEMLAAGAPADHVLAVVAHELTDMLSLSGCRFEEALAERPGPFVDRRGAVVWGAVRWPLRVWGLPARHITLTVENGGLPLGRFVLEPAPGSRVSETQLRVAVALADHAGAALAARPPERMRDAGR